MNWYKKANYEELDQILHQADLSLNEESQRAVSSFVGHPPQSKQERNDLGDDPFQLFGIMDSRQLEDAFSTETTEQGANVLQDLEQNMQPVKEYLYRLFGDTVPLHRYQHPLSGNEEPRNILSWTLNRNFVEAHAGIRPTIKVLNDADIEKYVQQFEMNGSVQVGNHIYRTDTELEGTDMFDLDGEHITGIGGGSNELRKWLHGQKDDDSRWNDQIENKNNEKRQNIISQNIQIKDIVWATNRAGQWEFVIKT